MPEVIMLHPRTRTTVSVQAEDEEEFLKRGYLPEEGEGGEPAGDGLDALKVDEMRQRLDDAGLETSGRKDELVERLRSAAEGSDADSAGDEGTDDEDTTGAGEGA